MQAEACLEPAGVLEQEQSYIEALSEARSAIVEGDTLALLNENNETLLVYERRVAYNMDPAALEGVTWVLQSLGNHELVENSHLTIRFSNGKMDGDAGCRAYQGLYQAEGDWITFPMFSMLGETTCADEALLAQEMLFTDYLELSTHYRVDGDRLELYTATGETMVVQNE